MSKINSILKEPILKTIILFFKTKFGVRSLNFIYENSGYKFKDFFIRNLKERDFKPKIDFIWEIKLLNGQKYKCKVFKNDNLSFYYALIYMWHDLGLSNLENTICNKISPNNSYWDIGANLGLRSMVSLTGKTETVLFEPNLDLNKRLIENIELNKVGKYEVINECVSDETGELPFYISKSTYLSSLHEGMSAREGESIEIKIKVIKLDDYHYSLPPKYIKVDVEGFELNVLKGAQKLIQEFKPIWVLEIFPEDKNKALIYEFMSNYNYLCFAVTNKKNKSLKIIETFENYLSDLNVNYLFIDEKNLTIIESEITK